MQTLAGEGISRAAGRLAASLPHGRSLPAAPWHARHRALLALLWAHVVALPLVALADGFPLWHALADGSVVAPFAVAAQLRLGSRRSQALLVVLGLLTSSAVLVHITGGLIEAHFHFFVVVALVSLYEDWVPFLAAIAYVLLQHGLMAGVVHRDDVFNHPGSAWKWSVVHSAFIAALSVACLINWRASERQRSATAALVDTLEEGVLLLDRHGRITSANPSAERALGADFERFGNGSDPTWMILDQDGEPLAEDQRPTRVAARTGQPVVGREVGLRGRDGTTTWLTMSVKPLSDGQDDRPPFPVVASFTDVTAQREARDALERSNAELEQFAYVASHDLSEPLRMVSSYLRLLRRRYGERLDDEADEFIGYAVDGATRMRALIEDLLAYSRAGSSRPLEAVDASRVVAETLKGLAPALVDARADISVGLLPWVKGDAGQLRQVFQNLIANALKFRRGDCAQVWVDAERAPGDPGIVVFSVADAGVGIEPAQRELIFDMFQRAHAGDAFQGTGIGLAIVRKIVERHGGRIWAEAREGGGTVFRFTLVAAPRPATREPEPEPARVV